MLKNLQTELQSFGKYVVQQSRSNLTKQKHNVSRGLYNSIHYKLDEKNGNYNLSFIMDYYGTFLDKGVKGTKSNYIQNSNSPYSYKNKKPPMKPLADWAKKRNIRLRDEKGKFKKGNYRTIGFILQNSIFEKGIRATMFFIKPFKVAFDRYPELLTKAFAQDIIDILKDNNNE